MRWATPISAGMRQRKTPLPPIIDNDPEKPIRPFGGKAAPFTPEEGTGLRDQLNRLATDDKKAETALHKICEGLQTCQTELMLQAIPRRPTSDLLKPLVAAAKTGRFNQKNPKQWLQDALIYGAQKVGTDVKVVMTGDCAAVKVAAKKALASKLWEEKSRRPVHTIHDEYTALLRQIYKDLTGSEPSLTRQTDASKTTGPHVVTGKAADFFRAAMAPLGASDEQVAEAILDRKLDRKKSRIKLAAARP